MAPPSLRPLMLTALGILGATHLIAAPAARAQLGPSPVTLHYTDQQNSPVPPPASDGYWAKAVLTEVAGGMQFDFTSNLSSEPDTQFLNDFVFSLNKELDISSVTCTDGVGTTCLAPSGPALYDYPSNTNFIGSSGWDLKLNTPNNPPASIGVAGESMSFTVLATVFTGTGDERAFSLADFDNATEPGGWYSCTHHQGFDDFAPGTPGSSRLCTGDKPDGEPVPGPLPLLGAAAAFGYSRKLRHRIQGSQQATVS